MMIEPLATLLHEHYKDTFAHIREREKQRDRLFLIVLAVLGLLVFQLQYALTLQQVVDEVSIAGFKMNLSKVPAPALLSLSWTFLTVVILRYYQVTVHVEKQYDYLHSLECSLSNALEGRYSIHRESSGYKTKKASLFRYWAWIFYTALFPAIVIVAVGWSLLLEWNAVVIPVPYRYFDSTLALIIICTLALYGIGVWLKR